MSPEPPTVATGEAGAAAADPHWGISGHDAAVAHLRHAIETDHFGHAYLLTGPGGVGKRTLAERIAQRLCCEASGAESGAEARPCLRCRTCRNIAAGAATDIDVLRPGGLCDASGHDHSRDTSQRIRICQVRRLERMANLAPFAAPLRIFIIDGADRLQAEAAHALLKTLEEPPATSLLLLTAVDPAALLDTVRSRCQEIPLRPMSRAALATALEAAEIDPAEAEALAASSGGRFGLAMRRHNDPTAQLLRQTARDDMRTLSRANRNERFDHVRGVARRWARERESVLEAIDAWREWWRAILLATVPASTVPAGTEPGGAAPIGAEPAAEVREDAAVCTPAQALGALRTIERLRDHLLANTQPQLALEAAMLDLPLLPALPPAEPTRGEAEADAEQAEDDTNH